VKITSWNIADVGELAYVYNEQIASIPHCYPVSPEEFEAGVRYRKDTNEPYENLHSQRLIVGEHDGGIAGFADVAVVSNIDEDGQKEHQGLIRMLTYRRGCRPVGQALLDEAERYLATLGENQIKAFRISYGTEYCYPFYKLGFGLVSDRTSHICALFRMNGYDVCGGEIFMNQPDYDVDEPVAPDNEVEISVEKKPARGDLPGLVVQALHGGKELGTCKSLSAGDYCRSIEAQDWVFIKWLGVDETTRVKGWGRYLLRRNLWEARKLGYRNTVISCDVKNPRAQLFYTIYGYRVADTAYGFTKDLKQ
jgi:ribosomal protein S18 acetylase RimI-like enzyme